MSWQLTGMALSRRQVALVDSNSAPNHPHSLVELSPRSLASAGLRARASRCSCALSIAALEHPRVKCAVFALLVSAVWCVGLIKNAVWFPTL